MNEGETKALELGHTSRKRSECGCWISSLAAAIPFLWARELPPNKVLLETFSENSGRRGEAGVAAGVS